MNRRRTPSGRRLCWLAFLGCLLVNVTSARADSIHQTIDTVQQRMVKLYGAGGLKNLAGYGTGFLVTPQGHIVTAWSHLLDTEAVTVVLHDGRRVYGKVIGTDFRKDLAVLKIEGEQLPCFDLTQTGSVGPGAAVLAFSNMFRVAVGDEPVTVTHGVVSARTELSARRGRYEVPYSGPIYVLDAVTNNPGAAGGVLTTYDGRLLAMLGREVKSDQTNTWLNYAVPIDELRLTVEDIIAGRFQRTDPLTEGDQHREKKYSLLDFGVVLVPDVVQRTPAYIETVVADSEAARAGLKPDDLIVFANGELVNSIQSLDGVLQRMMAGDDLQLIVRRDNALVSVTFRVPKKP
ncbi:S1C family serine protease [Planctomicrobium sp. SH664]|uniref:S1C family serine protease n=1 Tax=Planctomicrobium sp. SH664 TaxID=3448125 RepID=UPI003F5AFBA5